MRSVDIKCSSSMNKSKFLRWSKCTSREWTPNQLKPMMYFSLNKAYSMRSDNVEWSVMESGNEGGGGAEEGCVRGRRGSGLGLDCCWSLVALSAPSHLPCYLNAWKRVMWILLVHRCLTDGDGLSLLLATLVYELYGPLESWEYWEYPENNSNYC